MQQNPGGGNNPLPPYPNPPQPNANDNNNNNFLQSFNLLDVQFTDPLPPVMVSPAIDNPPVINNTPPFFPLYNPEIQQFPSYMDIKDVPFHELQPSVPTVDRRTPSIKEPRRKNQTSNLVATHLREILKEEGVYSSASSRTWQELYAQVVRNNLQHKIDNQWIGWINQCLVKPKSGKNISALPGIPQFNIDNNNNNTTTTTTSTTSTPYLSSPEMTPVHLSPQVLYSPLVQTPSPVTSPPEANVICGFSPSTLSTSAGTMEFLASILFNKSDPEIQTAAATATATTNISFPALSTSNPSTNININITTSGDGTTLKNLPVEAGDSKEVLYLHTLPRPLPYLADEAERAAPADALHADAVVANTIHASVVRANTVRSDAVRADTVQANTVHAVDVRAHRVLCNAFACLSDERTKTDIRKLSPDESLRIVRQLEACVFRYTQEFNGGDDRDVRGFIAQEVQRICPDLVEVLPSGILTVRTLEIFPIMCNAIRAIESRYDGLMEKVSNLNLATFGPIPLAHFENNELVINPRALEILKDIKTTVSVLGICGEGGDGNSSLCNRLLPTKDTDRYFATGRTTDRCTKGIWMSYPIKQHDPKRGDFTHIVIDCQGFDVGDKGVKVLSFLCFISTAMVLCQKTTLNNNLFEKLKAMIEVQKIIQKYGVTKSDLPSLIMLIRDAQLERDKKISAVTHLDNMLTKYDTELCKAISQFAPRTLMDTPHPKEPDFEKAVDELRTCVSRYCVPKRRDGAELAQRIQAGAEAIQKDLVQVKTPTFSQLVKCRAVTDEIMVNYTTGKLKANEVLRMFTEKTESVPEFSRETYLKEIQKRVKVSELLRLADQCEEELKTITVN